jgi:hypothetical protein
MVQMYISYSSCAKAKTNMLSSVLICLVLKLKGKWSIRQRQGFHSNSDSIIYPLSLLKKLSIGINLHSYLFYQKVEKVLGPKGGEFDRALKILRFWQLMLKGEKVLGPKQKDRTTTFFKNSKTISQKGRNYFNWYQNFNRYFIWFQKFN